MHMSSFRRGLFLAAVVFTFAGMARGAIIYDAVSDLATYTTSTSVPHTYMGQSFSVSNAGGSTPIVTSMKLGEFIVGAQTYAGVRLRIQFWGTFDPTATGATSVFSNPIGSPIVFDLGPQTTTGNSVSLWTLTGLNVTLPQTTNLGIGINWQSSTDGVNYVDQTNIATAMRAPVNTAPIPVGSNVTVAGQYYRNASSETNFNFLASSSRSIGGTNPNDGLAFQLSTVPEPTTAALAGFATLALSVRRRRA